MAELQIHILAAIGGYTLGSIPFGLLLTRFAGLGDVRKIGSGNIGATNVLRTGNKALALLTLLLDGGKGAAAVIVAQHLSSDGIAYAAGGAFLGHLFPVWLRFKGGKAVATFMGIMLALDFSLGLASCATWLLIALILRYSSLASLVSAGLSVIYAYLLVPTSMVLLTVGLALLIFWRHASNIGRLIDGSEPKIENR
jgi:glycerol-3-phosphate acyltransferase PlsY